MQKQVLILNMTRLGDLVQTVPMLRRLEEESPGVAIDLVVDTCLDPMAALLPGLRHIHTYDFKNAFKQVPDDPQENAALSPDIAAWARSLTAIGYDRVINLTFTRWGAVCWLQPSVREGSRSVRMARPCYSGRKISTGEKLVEM